VTRTRALRGCGRSLALIAAIVSSEAGAQAVVRGAVHDSLIARAPLAGATVLVHGTTRTATTDRRGRFVIRDLPAGQYTFGFFHPALDSLGLAAPYVTAQVGAVGTVNVSLATPSENGLSLRLCGRPAEVATAVVFGEVRAAEDVKPLMGAEASIRWTEVEPLAATPRDVERVASALSDSAGNYTLCGVPNDVSLSMIVAHGEQSTGPLHLALGGAGIARRDVTVSLTDSAARRLPETSAVDTLSVARPPGSARVRIVVRTTQGRPVKDAVVGIRGSRSSATTDQAGQANLRGVPAGSQTLVVRAIGFSPFYTVVALTPGAELALNVSTEKFTTLPTVTVAGLRRTRLDEEYERRKQQGLGRFFEGAALRELADGLGLWSGTPGLWMAKGGSDAMPMMRDAVQGRCTPAVWLDGRRMPNVEGWELRLMMKDARRMEVYTYFASVPVQYMVKGPMRDGFTTTGDTAAGCGAILIWTH